MKRATVVWLAETELLPAFLQQKQEVTVPLETIRKASVEFNLLHNAVLEVIRILGPAVESGPMQQDGQEAWSKMKMLAEALGEPPDQAQ